MVKIYALSTCPWCKKTKQFFADRGIAYEAIDVDMLEGDGQAAALAEVERLTGKRNFPVTIVNGRVIAGFQPDQLEKALGDEQV